MISKALRYPKSVIREIISDKLPRWSVNSKKMSALYYLLFDRSFDRELQAVLAGRIQHIDDTNKLKANYFLLVRNTHRLEKGLLMRPRRPIFGKDFITETVDSFSGIWTQEEHIGPNPQMKWFFDVLSEYFANMDLTDPLIKAEEQRFREVVGRAKDPKQLNINGKRVPYLRLDQNKSSIDFEEFYKLCKQRRSVRWFLDKPVPRELIDKAIMSANQAPSACNRQPFEFRVFDDPEMVKEVVKFPMGTKGYGHSIQVMVVIVGNLDAYFDERDRHVMYIDASLASMSMMFALETMGLSSCSINWPDMEDREQKMESFLKLEKYQRPIMCMGIGYPDPEGLVAFSEKRPINQIRKYN